jgi:hypothetical protein
MLYVYTDYFLNIIKKCCLGNEGDHAKPVLSYFVMTG